jgi:hypothetical protein
MAKGKEAEKSGEKKEPKVKKPEATKVPDLKDKKGNLLKLRPSDFPRSKEGRMAFCDYQIAKWTDKKDKYSKGDDPRAQKLAKLEKLKQKLDELEKELAESK